MKIAGRHDLEEFSLQLQKMVARFQEQDVYSVEACSLYLEILNPQGERMMLKDASGKPIEVLEIGENDWVSKN